MSKKNKKSKGITLIALVVTIIVLIILAGISINLILGENGIIVQAQKTKEQNKKAEVEEQVKLAVMSAKTSGLGIIDYTQLNSELDKIGYEGAYITKLPAEVTINDVTVKIKADGSTEIKNIVTGEDDENTIVADKLGITPKINLDEMKPVKYDETTETWVEADVTVEGDWFDYSEKNGQM